MKTTGDLQLLRRINRSVLLRLIRSQPGLSRARLATLSGLTKSTVSGLVRELLDEHWLTELIAPVAGQGMGRPSTPLEIDANKRVLVGIEIAVDCVRIVSVSLTGEVLSHQEAVLDDPRPSSACALATRLLSALTRELDVNHWLLTGVGVCLPGAIDEAGGIVRLAPNLGWRNVPFLEMLAQEFGRLGIPATQIHLQNDGDTAALGEYEFGGGGNEDPLIFLNCDVGVGAGVVLNDRLFTGARGTAGEIGHTVLQVNGPLCSCGRRGCAEAFVGARALQEHTSLDHAAQYLGMMLQNVDAMFNPRVIVIGGRSTFEHPGLVDAARQTQCSYAQSAGMQAPEVRPARYGLHAAAVGAAALVLHEFLRPLLKDANHVAG
ncbi:MAG: ROK family transcriptional regulator [Betaproteobacteria bacterium]|nr:ROK family transcriptional regulator [Betaproteobacteria bacterium]